MSTKNLSLNYLYTNIIGQDYRDQQHLQKFLVVKQQNLRGFGPDGSINDLQHNNVTALKQLSGKSENYNSLHHFKTAAQTTLVFLVHKSSQTSRQSQLH